jgi:hypothetical protein
MQSDCSHVPVDFSQAASIDLLRVAECRRARGLRSRNHRSAFSILPKARLKFIPMVSRAYHDSLFMARIAPVAMLFIPCRNGYSHRPDEYASPEDIVRGTLVLAETLATLAA